MRLIADYHHWTGWIVHISGQTDKFVHVQVGLIIWLVGAAITGRRLGSFVPLGVVLLAEIGNEILDRLYYGNWNWPDTIGDAASTWAWPIVLTIVLAIDHRRRKWWPGSALRQPVVTLRGEQDDATPPAPARSVG